MFPACFMFPPCFYLHLLLFPPLPLPPPSLSLPLPSHPPALPPPPPSVQLRDTAREAFNVARACEGGSAAACHEMGDLSYETRQYDVASAWCFPPPSFLWSHDAFFARTRRANMMWRAHGVFVLLFLLFCDHMMLFFLIFSLLFLWLFFCVHEMDDLSHGKRWRAALWFLFNFFHFFVVGRPPAPDASWELYYFLKQKLVNFSNTRQHLLTERQRLVRELKKTIDDYGFYSRPKKNQFVFLLDKDGFYSWLKINNQLTKD